MIIIIFVIFNDTTVKGGCKFQDKGNRVYTAKKRNLK